MSIICKLFGHSTKTTRYAKARYLATDGMGTEHYILNMECPRCGARHDVGRMHAPTTLNHQRALDALRALERPSTFDNLPDSAL